MLAFAEHDGKHSIGRYARSVLVGDKRFGVIEKSHEFTLVPWRPVFERHAGRYVERLQRGDGISWTLGRGRSGPSIS
ncbi:DUF3363 domain-containing protein [Sphingomonas sp. MG17]|uniref:DUF3363 domain-containing protein n=1 Tax=Sphingomonas tagetis TaxID=2949092 RepID=A0A9X2KP34_9SPHN|nr:DUF3363 domain-containing protein [Sphingomonas tagetis]